MEETEETEETEKMEEIQEQEQEQEQKMIKVAVISTTIKRAYLEEITEPEVFNEDQKRFDFLTDTVFSVTNKNRHNIQYMSIEPFLPIVIHDLRDFYNGVHNDTSIDTGKILDMDKSALSILVIDSFHKIGMIEGVQPQGEEMVRDFPKHEGWLWKDTLLNLCFQSVTPSWMQFLNDKKIAGLTFLGNMQGATFPKLVEAMHAVSDVSQDDVDYYHKFVDERLENMEVDHDRLGRLSTSFAAACRGLLLPAIAFMRLVAHLFWKAWIFDGVLPQLPTFLDLQLMRYKVSEEDLEYVLVEMVMDYLFSAGDKDVLIEGDPVPPYLYVFPKLLDFARFVMWYSSIDRIQMARQMVHLEACFFAYMGEFAINNTLLKDCMNNSHFAAYAWNARHMICYNVFLEDLSDTSTTRERMKQFADGQLALLRDCLTKDENDKLDTALENYSGSDGYTDIDELFEIVFSLSGKNALDTAVHFNNLVKNFIDIIDDSHQDSLIYFNVIVSFIGRRATKNEAVRPSEMNGVIKDAFDIIRVRQGIFPQHHQQMLFKWIQHGASLGNPFHNRCDFFSFENPPPSSTATPKVNVSELVEVADKCSSANIIPLSNERQRKNMEYVFQDKDTRTLIGAMVRGMPVFSEYVDNKAVIAVGMKMLEGRSNFNVRMRRCNVTSIFSLSSKGSKAGLFIPPTLNSPGKSVPAANQELLIIEALSQVAVDALGPTHALAHHSEAQEDYKTSVEMLSKFVEHTGKLSYDQLRVQFLRQGVEVVPMRLADMFLRMYLQHTLNEATLKETRETKKQKNKAWREKKESVLFMVPTYGQSTEFPTFNDTLYLSTYQCEVYMRMLVPDHMNFIREYNYNLPRSAGDLVSDFELLNGQNKKTPFSGMAGEIQTLVTEPAPTCTVIALALVIAIEIDMQFVDNLTILTAKLESFKKKETVFLEATRKILEFIINQINKIVEERKTAAPDDKNVKGLRYMKYNGTTSQNDYAEKMLEINGLLVDKKLFGISCETLADRVFIYALLRNIIVVHFPEQKCTRPWNLNHPDTKIKLTQLWDDVYMHENSSAYLQDIHEGLRSVK